MIFIFIFFASLTSTISLNNDYYELESYDIEARNPLDINNILNDILNGKAPNTISNESFINEEISYDSSLRPSGIKGKNKNINDNGSLIFSAMFSLRQIVSLDEKNQILTTSFYLLLKWGDPRLMWDPLQYKNMTSIIVPANKFWLPDLAVMNSASFTNFITYPSNQNVVIFNNGNTYLTLSFPSLSTRCQLDVYKYPFDTQKCSIIIGSWTNTNREIVFKNLTTSTEYIINNSIWHLKNIEYLSIINKNRFDIINIDIKSDSSFQGIDMNFVLHLRRQPLYIMINGIFPCFVLNFVILFAFGVPFVQQINLCMTSFLTFVVTSLRVSNEIPIQSDYLPLITLYMILSILYTFYGFTWFIMKEKLSKQKKLPFVLIKVAFLINCLTKIKPKLPKNKIKNENPKSVSENESEKSEIQDIKTIEEIKEKNDSSKIKDEMIDEEMKRNIRALNLLAFLILLTIMFTLNLTIWILISN